MTTDQGSVSGSGRDRRYTTRDGDTLEGLAAFFYGSEAHVQRLMEENPELEQYRGQSLPGGMSIAVSEDPDKGDVSSV